MALEAKYKIGDYVYFIDKKHGIRGGEIISSKVKHMRCFDQTIMYTIKGYNNDFEEEELFTSKSKVFREMCLWLEVDINKVEYVCKYLFPDEVTEDDFNTVLFDYLEGVDTWLNGPQIREKQMLFPEVKYKKRKKSFWERFKESLT